MREVTIPEGWNPCKITVNNVTYEYPAGQTVEVPDEVAAIIEMGAANVYKAKDQRQVFSLEFGPDDAGKVLTVNEDETGAKWAEASGGGSGGIMVVTPSYDESISNYVLDKKAKEISDAIDSGIFVIIKNVDETHYELYTLCRVDIFSNGSYQFEFNKATGQDYYSASGDDEYPTMYIPD